MACTIAHNQAIPSVQQVIGILEYYNSKMPLPLDYDRMLEYYSLNTIEANRILTSIGRYIGKITSDPVTADEFKKFLRRNNATNGLMLTKGKDISLKAESLENAAALDCYSDEMKKVMLLYARASSLKSSVNVFPRIFENSKPAKVPTYDGHRMIFVSPTWVPQNTSRVGMQNPAIQNIKREYKDIHTYPKGWIRISTDASQIEPRIIYSAYLKDPQIKALIKAYNDAYFAVLHYCTMDDIFIRDGIMDFELADTSTDEMKNRRQKLKTFGNGVMYGSTANENNDPIKAAYIRRIGQHPMRLAWADECKRQIARGDMIFYSYFGTPVDITKSQKTNDIEYGTSEWDSHILHCAINNPIQTTAGDLMRFAVMAAHKIIRADGPNSVISKQEHDSIDTIIHENDWDKISDPLKDIMAFNIEDWIPIGSEAVIGRKDNSEVPRLY
jgi:hypothetical protein